MIPISRPIQTPENIPEAEMVCRQKCHYPLGAVVSSIPWTFYLLVTHRNITLALLFPKATAKSSIVASFEMLEPARNFGLELDNQRFEIEQRNLSLVLLRQI